MTTCHDCPWFDEDEEREYCTHPNSRLFPSQEEIDQMIQSGYEVDADDCPGFDDGHILSRPVVPPARVKVIFYP